jgi:hypothetical protein
VTVLLVCALPAQVRGPSPPLRNADDLRAALAGDDPMRAAWAAYFARVRSERALVPQLREQLKRWDGADAQSREVRLHALDALLALDAKVPGSYVLPLIDDPLCGVPAFLLLAKEPRHHEKELFDLFVRELRATDREQALSGRAAAIGGLLAELRTPGFAAAVAARADVGARVAVADGGRARDPMRLWTIERGEAILPGAPPRPVYAFARSDGTIPSRAQRIALSAPLRGFVLRHEVDEGQVESFTLDRTLRGANGGDALVWLAAMAGWPAPPADVVVPFRDDATFVAAATAARDEKQRWLDGLRARLIERELLTVEEAKPLTTAVDVVVQDRRSDPSLPLPRIAPKK